MVDQSVLTATQTVLVVEDDPGHARLIQRYLRRAGVEAEIVCVGNGLEGMHYLAARNSVEGVVVLLDVNMPVMDGFEFLRRVRADRRLRTLPVIVLTTGEREESDCRELACDGFYSKPSDPAAFRHTIGQIAEWIDGYLT